MKREPDIELTGIAAIWRKTDMPIGKPYAETIREQAAGFFVLLTQEMPVLRS
jgi:hypothetical protein